MSDAERGGFFSRWSKLKTEQRASAPASAPLPAAQPAQVAVPPLATPPTVSVAPAQAPEPSGPSLADVAQLTHESDFRPFVARHVAPAVKNAAFKKLFADPHFNIMDGLDIYIDDYSQPSPLLPEDLKQMVAAKVMKLVEDDPPSEVAHTSIPKNHQPNKPLTLENKAQAAIEIESEVKNGDATHSESNQPFA